MVTNQCEQPVLQNWHYCISVLFKWNDKIGNQMLVTSLKQSVKKPVFDFLCSITWYSHSTWFHQPSVMMSNSWRKSAGFK